MQQLIYPTINLCNNLVFTRLLNKDPQMSVEKGESGEDLNGGEGEHGGGAGMQREPNDSR
jgi:hypothetical protein